MFDKTEMVRLYNQGLTLRKIADRFGCHEDTVRLNLLQAGVTLRRALRTGQYLTFDHQEAARLYREGLTQTQIAERFGVCQASIGVALRHQGVACKDRRILEWPIEEMRRWYEEDRMTVEQIATRLGRQRVATNKVLRRNGVKMRRVGPKSGAEHTGWKGGGQIEKEGYVLVYMPDHPDANHKGQVREHRIVAEQMLGRRLLPKEVVHHKNDDPSDNRPENLQVFDTNADHLAATLIGKVPRWTEEGLARIAEGIRKPRKRRTTRDPSTPDASGSQGTTPHSTV